MDLGGPIPPILPNDAATDEDVPLIAGRVPESELPMTKLLSKERMDLLGGARLKNTFLEFADDEDPWLVRPNPRRQHTDSILDRSSQSLSAQLEQNIIETLQGHLALNSNPPGIGSGLPRQLAEVPSARPRANFDLPFRGNVVEDLWNKPAGLTRLSGSEFPTVGDPDFYFEDNLEQPAPFETKFEAARSQQQVLSAALAANGNPRQLHPGLANPAMGTLMQRFQMTAEMPANLLEAPLEEDEEGLGEAQNQEVDPEVQARRDLAAAGQGLSGCTSIMIRHIPCKYTQRKLMREINSAGFLGRYDFFYLPMDPRSHANRGFAFLNFVNAEVAEDFYRTFHGQRLKHFNSEKVIAIMPADLQGFDQNAAHYAESRALRRKRAQHSKPLFFRPLPAHLIPDDSIEVHLDQPIFTGPLTDKTSTCNWGSTAVKIAKASLANADGKNATGAHKRHQDVNLASAGYAQASAKQPRFCPYCGHQRLPQHLFCPYCGGQFNE